jgi:uncharacterized protein (DUF1330 family)
MAVQPYSHRAVWTATFFKDISSNPVMTHAYVVGQITIKDPLKWAAYRDQVPFTLEPWDAELVFRGRQRAALAGVNPHTDIVVIRFPNGAAADGWFKSEVYQALIPLREQAADVVLTSYET